MNRAATVPDRSAGMAIGVALLAHLVIFGLLSTTWGGKTPRAWPEPTPIEVSLVTDVAPEAQAPRAPEPPTASIAPDQGLPEEAAPPPAPVPERAKPTPPEPTPAKPAPPQPAAKPAAKPAPAPAPAPKPAAKPAPAKPAPAAKPAARPATAAPARPRSDRLAGLSLGTAGTNPNATAARPRGARLGDDFLKGLSADAPRRAASDAAPGAKPGPYPTASIVGAIARQIQPCADRQVNPGPGANRIVTTLNIRLNRDGTLAATPTRVRQAGVNDENERYAQRVTDLGIAAFKGCSPLKLPSEYYQTASGGWNNINYQWQLR